MSKQKHNFPCQFEDCGSSDAVTKYYEAGVFVRQHCFACGRTTFADKLEKEMDEDEMTNSVTQIDPYQSSAQEAMFVPVVGNFEDIPERGLSKKTCQKYGIQVRRNEAGEKTSYIFNYYDHNGDIVAQKFRAVADKKRMKIVGNISKAVLFGQQAFQAGGKYITVTVGEFDAPAAFQMFGDKWPCVSIKNGDQSALNEFRKEQVWKWINSFDHIVLAFDADASGQDAVQKIIDSKVFDFKKLKLMSMRHKDANAYLTNKDERAFQEDFWNAHSYIPKNIIRASDMKTLALTKQPLQYVPYLWDGLNALLHGIFSPSLITITAGSGVGKSTVMRTLMRHVLNNTPDEVTLGGLMLEEPVRDTIRGLMTISLNKNLNLEELPDSGVTATEQEKEQAFDELFSKDRVYLYGDFGSNLIDQIITDVTYMANGLGCKYIFLDHISIIVASQENGDERKALDEVTVKLRELCHTLNITIFLVCHTKRPVGKPHEEGGQTSLSDLRGTAGIGQMSDVVLGLERNGQHPNPFIRDTTVLRVLKNRRFGRTGPAAYLKYTHEKGTLHEIDEIEYQMELEGKSSGSGGKSNPEEDRPVFDNTSLGDF